MPGRTRSSTMEPNRASPSTDSKRAARGIHPGPPHRTHTNAKEPEMTSSIKRKQHLAAYAFVLPFFVVFATMLVAPLLYSGYLSFFVDRLIGGVSFVGFENYLRAFQDPNFLAGLGRTAMILVIQVPIMLGLAL